VRIIIFSTVMLLVAFGAVVASETEAAKDTKSESAATAETKQPEITEDRVVANVDKVPIMFSEVDKRVDNFEAKFKEINPEMKLSEERRAQMRKQFLDRMIRDKILENAASKMKVKITDEEVNARIEQLQKIFGEGDEARKRFLGGIKDMDEFKDNIRRQIRIDQYMEERMKDISAAVNDATIQSYYQKNLDKFMENESVNARHIFWKLPVKEDPEYDAKYQNAITKSTEVMKFVQDGKDFGELAKTYSEDVKTASKSGDLGWITKGRMLKAFEDVAFSLVAGEVSKPVETTGGIHLIQVVEKKESKMKSLEESKDQIKTILERKTKGEEREKIIKELEANAKVENLL